MGSQWLISMFNSMAITLYKDIARVSKQIACPFLVNFDGKSLVVVDQTVHCLFNRFLLHVALFVLCLILAERQAKIEKRHLVVSFDYHSNVPKSILHK